MTQLRTRLESVETVLDVRGRGCMIGIQLSKPCQPLFAQAMREGLIINVTAGSVIRLLPPMIMRDEEADLLVEKLVPLITNFESNET